MSALHPTFSPSTGPDAAYTPGTFNETDGSFVKGVTPAVWLAGQLNAVNVKLFDATVGSSTTGLVYAVGDVLGQIVTFDAASKTLVTVWRNLTQGTLLTGVPAVTTYVPSALQGNEARNGVVSGGLDSRRNNFVRPNDTAVYAAGDLMGRSTGVNNAIDGTGNIMPLFVARGINTISANTRLRMSKSGTSLSNASFRVHLFDNVPVLTVGDNGVFNTSPGGTGGSFACNSAANYIGCYDIVMDRAFSDGAWGAAMPQIGSSMIVAPAAGSKAISAVIEARAAYQPVANEAFAFVLDNSQD